VVAKHKNADSFVLKIFKINDVKNQLKYLGSFSYGRQYITDEEYGKINKTW
jgi:hypothetical protein